MATRPVEPFDPFADLLTGAEEKRRSPAAMAKPMTQKSAGLVQEALGFKPVPEVAAGVNVVSPDIFHETVAAAAKAPIPATTTATIKHAVKASTPSAKDALHASTHLNTSPNITLPTQRHFVEPFNHALLTVKQPVEPIPMLDKLKPGAVSGLETPDWWVPNGQVSGKSALRASTVLRDAPARIAVPAYRVVSHDEVSAMVREIAAKNKLNPHQYADLCMDVAQHEDLRKLPLTELRNAIDDAFTCRTSLKANGATSKVLEGGATLLDGAQAFKRRGGEVGVEHVLKANADRVATRNFVPVLDEGRMAALRAKVSAARPSNLVQSVKEASKLTTLEKVNGSMAAAVALLCVFGGGASLQQAFAKKAKQPAGVAANDNPQPSIHAPSLLMAALQFTLAAGAAYSAHHAFTAAR